MVFPSPAHLRVLHLQLREPPPQPLVLALQRLTALLPRPRISALQGRERDKKCTSFKLYLGGEPDVVRNEEDGGTRRR